LGESVVETDGSDQFGPSARGIFHAVEMLMKLIDVLASTFVAFGGLAVDWRMTGIDDALKEGSLNVILIYLEHR
jgi:hypothetical protein